MDFSQKMAGLRPRYLGRCSARIAELVPLLGRAEHLDNHELELVRSVFHGFAGTAGSLGLTEIGDEARKADELLYAILKSGKSLDSDQAQLLRSQAERVRALISQAEG